MVEQSKGEQPSAFNPALAYVQSLAKLMDMFDGMMLIQDYAKAYVIASRIYGRINHKLNKDQKKIIDDLRNHIIPMINRPTKQNFGELGQKIEELDQEIKKLMEKYKLLMPSTDDPRFAVLKR